MIQIDGDAAVSALHSDSLAASPDFVAAYHPACPHCHSMVQDFIKLADKVKDSNAKVNVVAINMSKTMK